MARVRIAFIIISSMVLSVCFFGCSRYSDEEKKIVNFLNLHEKSFDKDNFELVQLMELDTLMENEIYSVQEILSEPSDFDLYEVTGVDTIDSTQSLNSISWNHEDFPVKLYNILTDFNQYSYYADYSRVKTFLEESKIGSPESFEKELMNNRVFIDSLRSNMAYYSEPFTGCFDSDSLAKNILIWQKKRQSLYGYLSFLKFRSKNQLNQRVLLYNKKRELIGYKSYDEE